MINSEDLHLYLPKYLSPETESKLLQDLSDFPENIDKRIYEFFGKNSEIIYQGDSIKELPCIRLPKKEIKEVASFIISNTCDNDISNQRKFTSNLIYSPIMSLKKYEAMLLENVADTKESIRGHIDDIRKQKLTQIFYLPIGSGFNEEKIVFFDKICTCDSNFVKRTNLEKLRLNSLSQYGFYLLLYKLSIHFTRFHENVDRKY